MARIGETRAQCEARYGPSLKLRSDGDTSVHERAGLQIQCIYFDGKCESIRFSKLVEPRADAVPLTEAEVKTLMEASSGGRPWTLSSSDEATHFRAWECGTLSAMYSGNITHELIISTAAHHQRLKDKAAAVEAAKGKGSLKDF
ncbi:hypothetical protein BGE01nite_56970 [Brevifollis gellanilyticus]|uniref:Uncharacterized protein n=2 Tax=Brevifollis gellanilyticus TaxID=748831 RepID=A0A512MI38_9BACT|nr:hypothetical protein BGE01nite_56970 [Brevifollis gellanilyticus]